MILTLDTIRRRFGNAASSYEKVADVQRLSADFLVKKIQQFSVRPPKTILDIGSGTGYLALQMHTLFPMASLTVNDLCPQMLESCRKRFTGCSKIHYLLQDMSQLDKQPYDYIVSNLAFQWAQALPRLLRLTHAKAQNLLAFSTLTEETFRSWRQRIARYQDAPPLGYPSEQQLVRYCHALMAPGDKFFYWTQSFSRHFPDNLSFMRYLKQLGASACNIPLTFQTHRALYAAPASPLTIDYHIFFALFERSHNATLY